MVGSSNCEVLLHNLICSLPASMQGTKDIREAADSPPGVLEIIGLEAIGREQKNYTSRFGNRAEAQFPTSVGVSKWQVPSELGSVTGPGSRLGSSLEWLLIRKY